MRWILTVGALVVGGYANGQQAPRPPQAPSIEHFKPAVPKEANSPPQHNKQAAVTPADSYSSIYKRVEAGERVTVVVGPGGVVVPGVSPGTYDCLLFNGKPSWQPAAVYSLPNFTSPFAAPVQSNCPNGRCPLQTQSQFKW